MDGLNPQTLWKVLLVMLTVANVVSSVGFAVGRWTRGREDESGGLKDDVKRLSGELRDVQAAQRGDHMTQKNDREVFYKLAGNLDIRLARVEERSVSNVERMERLERWRDAMNGYDK